MIIASAAVSATPSGSGKTAPGGSDGVLRVAAGAHERGDAPPVRLAHDLAAGDQRQLVGGQV
jgi:hypothetical protein